MRLSRGPLAIVVALLLLVVAAAVAALLTGGDDNDKSAQLPPRPLQVLEALGEGPLGTAVVPLERWRYRKDASDQGRARGWAEGRFGGRYVGLPDSPNAGHITAEQAYQGSVGWYAREIEAPVAGRYALSFASAHHDATVYVDGRRVRRHVGAYEPFLAAADLAPGKHTVSVRVDWRGPRRQAKAGFGRGWFNFGGLNGAVGLARIGPSALDALNVETRLVTGGTAEVRVGVRVRNRGPARSLQPEGSLSLGSQRLELAFAPERVPENGERTFTTTVRVPTPTLWSPESPERYALSLSIDGESQIQRKVGLRELRWDKGRLRLNGQPLRLRGVGLPADVDGHGDALTAADEAQTITQLQATGANATRAQHPLSDTFLERLDAAGILLWQEIGPWEPAGAFRAPSVGEARDRALRAAEREQAHASVVAWTLTNEAAGGGQPRQVDYVKQTARALHRSDPSRPVAVDLWGRVLPREDGPLLRAVDAIGVTDYTGWYEGSTLSAREQATEVRERIAGLSRLAPDKPIVVTEFGAVGTPRVAPGDFGGEAFQARLLGRRTRDLAGIPSLSGEMVWLLRDHAIRPGFDGGSIRDDHPGLDLEPGINEKGLFGISGRRKPALFAVRAAFDSAAG